MSSALRVFPSPGRPLPAGVVPASRLGVRPQPRTISTGIPQVDALTGGVPRSGLTEIFGPASSGRTSLLLSVLAQVTAREEVCALVDASDAFDPGSAQAAGVDLKRVLWVRCGGNPPQRHGGTKDREIGSSGHRVIDPAMDSMTRSPDHPITRFSMPSNRRASSRVEQALRALDLLLQAGGFGLVAMDLGDIPPAIARRVPLTSWFRFRRAVENTATALVVVEQEASAQSCASLVLKTKHSSISTQQSAKTERAPAHARLLHGMQLEVEVMYSRILERKPVRSTTTSFESRASWVG
jgi:hypothetical protein